MSRFSAVFGQYHKFPSTALSDLRRNPLSSPLPCLSNAKNGAIFNNGKSVSPLLRSSMPVVTIPYRTYIHADRTDGKKKTDEDVPIRYFRLDWGGWIRRIMGAHKRVHKMHPRRLRVKDLHVFVPRHYSKKFDRMVTTEYRTPKYYVDDIYEPYQKRYGQEPIYYISREDEMHRKLDFPELPPEVLAKRRQPETSGKSE